MNQAVNIHLKPSLNHRCADSPLIGSDQMPFDVLQIAVQVILQRVDDAAVFVHQLGGSRLGRQPVHQRRQLILLHLLSGTNN